MDVSSNILAVFSVPEFFISFLLLIVISILVLKIILSFSKVLFTYLKTKEFIDELVVSTNDEINLVLNKVDLVFTAGLLNPQIYISKNIFSKLNSKELEVVLDHERAHIKSRDNLKSIVMNFIFLSIPFLARTNLMNSYEVLTELSADEINLKSKTSKKHIVSSLYKMISSEKSMFFSSFSDVSDRVEVILEKKRFLISWSNYFVGFGMLVLLIIGSVTFLKLNPLNKCEDVFVCFGDIITKVEAEENDLSQCVELNYTEGNFSRIDTNMSKL